MSLATWLFVLGGVYVFGLVAATVSARKQNNSDEDFVTAGSDLGFILGCLTLAATLFSTFTLLGMPDFFRSHGVGAWIFLAVSDAALAFMVIWFGIKLRKKAQQLGFRGVAGLMHDCYGSRWAGYLYLAGIFVFLVPYVAIQIRGIGIFMNAIFPEFLPVWGWAFCIVAVMLVYSELGGLKAIIYADAIQGVILLAVTLLIAYGCYQSFGNIEAMFQQVAEKEEGLLSIPGPKGLLSAQFLIASFIAIVLVPVTQPQMSTRLVIIKDRYSLIRVAILLGLFATVIIAATLFIGMYGAVNHADASPSEFMAKALIFDQLPVVGAVVAIGLIAAAISTADSQLFALGSEVRSMLTVEGPKLMQLTKFAIMFFAMASLVTAIFSGDQLVLLARLSFAGTAILGPLVLTAILSKGQAGKEMLISSAIALLIFTASVFGLLPDHIGSLRLDLLLFIVLFAISGASLWIRHFLMPDAEHTKASSSSELAG